MKPSAMSTPSCAVRSSPRATARGGVVTLMQVLGRPDIVIATNEMQTRTSGADPVETIQQQVIALHDEMGIIKPEIEDIPQQDHVWNTSKVVQQ